MKTRVESDALGKVAVPADRYWGAVTQRSLENFRIGHQVFPRSFIRALGVVKKAAAIANRDVGALPASIASLIVRAADEVIAGTLDAHFPLVVWQTGSGTQTNMNANEVIANRAIELAGGVLGSKVPVHPNDHVNKSQSSNDVIPTAMHVALACEVRDRLLAAVESLRQTYAQKIAATEEVVKIGRTHLMDATPLTLGQELSGHEFQVAQAERRIYEALDGLYELVLGGTAVGTGLNAPPDFAARAIDAIAHETGLPCRAVTNRFGATAAHDAVVALSGTLRQLAVAMIKIAGDLRLLASGPRAGLGELRLPANEPGSSIMPGKVNPTQCEAMIMVCYQVIGHDQAIAWAGAGGQLELNACKPLLVHAALEAVGLLADALRSFDQRCVAGLEANTGTVQRHLESSLMLVTALTPVIGYDKAALVAKTAAAENLTLREAALKLGVMQGEEFDRHVRPELMIGRD